MNADNTKTRKLIDSLYTLTEDGKLNWKESTEPGEYVVSLSRFSVLIKSSKGSLLGLEGSLPSDIILEIIDRSGRTVETIRSTNEGNLLQASGLVVNQFVELYKLARRKALKTDEAIDELIQSLNEML